MMVLVQEGDEIAFRRLFDHYKKPIMNYVYNLVHNIDLAEDITHDVFLKVYRNRPSFNAEYRFSTWLWRIARK